MRKPYLRVANVQDGYLDLSEIKEIDVPLAQVERFRLQMDDVLLTEGGDFDKLGRGCVWRDEIPDCVHQNHIFAVRVTVHEKILPQFLACQIQSARAKNYFLSCAKQTTNLASINSSQIKKLPVLLPPHDEQQGIVHALSIWDAAIEKTERIIFAQEDLYSALLISLIHRPTPKKLWRRKHLGDIATIRKGQQLNVSDMIDNGKYYALNGGISPSGRTDKWNAFENTITISEGGNSCGYVNFFTEKFWCGGHCYALTDISDQVNARFLFHYLKSRQGKLMALRVGSGLPNIQKNDIESFTVNIAPLSEQHRIASILDATRVEIIYLENLVAAYKTQKRGLMQKLLTGTWRIRVPKETVRS